ncbi:MAG: class I SAM-dependent methyltransferase [wastewater metagenome]|nr:class I SAM-dependent methyltransferase [Candidatus Loosdrechtia aerotolerans]
MKDEDITEQVNCLLCGEKNNVPSFYEEYYLKATKIVLGINQCRSCSLCYVSPRLNAQGLALLYNSSYLDDTVSGRYNTEECVSRNEYVQFVQYVSKNIPRGSRVLDVGCGVGLLLDALREASIDLQLSGVELSSFAAEKAISKGFDVCVGDFSSDNLVASGSIDAIIFLYVLEHVPDPASFLKAAHYALNDSGCLFLAVPNYRYLKIVKTGFLSKIIFGKSSNIHAAEHLFNFTPRTIGIMLQQAGFEIIYLGQSKPLNIGSPLFRLIKMIGAGFARLFGIFGFYVGGIHIIARKKNSTDDV